MRTYRFTLLAAMGIAAATGCRGQLREKFFPPGPMQYQQEKAQRWDPFPLEMSHNAQDEVRPREFNRPPAPATRGQPYEFGMPKYGTYPPPRIIAPGEE